MARNVPVCMRATLEEVEAMRRAQKEDNRIRPQQARVQKLGDWCLGLIREHLEFRRKAEAAEMQKFAARLEGDAGHVAAGDPPKVFSVAHETPSTPLRSWASITDPVDRAAHAAKYIKGCPLPEGFKDWNNMHKIEWLDRNWTLGGLNVEGCG